MVSLRVISYFFIFLFYLTQGILYRGATGTQAWKEGD
jgi:hypothetical protein